MCIYKVYPIAYKLIDDYFSSTKADLYRKIKKEKENLSTENVTKNVTVYITNNIYEKNFIKSIFFKKNHQRKIKKTILEKTLKLSKEITEEIKKIVKESKNPEKTYKNTLFNYKDFFNYLSFDYKKEDILSFFFKQT
ncbi:conserved hypothetical protein (plasmid) [Borreliella finlandensis]|uniref:Uncharacterized protein n=1 Tax=Borreliella finlandensis TaxID=498741 RepID=A0A806C7P5_9SPIR|nr:conserved hypothetical protein [Borreliella finlandensis]